MKLRLKYLLTIVSIAMFVLVNTSLSSDAWARGPRRGRSSSNSNNSRRQNNQRQQPAAAPRQNPQVAKAINNVNAAQVEVDKAQSALNLVVQSLKTAFDQSPEMAAALAAVQDAQAAEKAAVAVVDGALNNDAGFQAASRKKDDAETALSQLQHAEAKPDDISTAAQALMNTSAVVTKLQSDAESADPKVVQSRTNLTAANEKVNALDKQFENSIQTDSKWMSAKKTLDEKTAALTAARAALAALENK